MKTASENLVNLTYLEWGEEGAQQARAQAGGADLLLLCLGVVGIFEQLDLMEDESWKALIQEAETQNVADVNTG